MRQIIAGGTRIRNRHQPVSRLLCIGCPTLACTRAPVSRAPECGLSPSLSPVAIAFLYDYCCANLLGASLLLCHQPFQLGLVIFNDLTRHINDYLLDLSGEGGFRVCIP